MKSQEETYKDVQFDLTVRQPQDEFVSFVVMLQINNYDIMV